MKKKDIKYAVNRAIDNIILEGCTDVSVFGRPFELKLLKDKLFRSEIVSNVVSLLDGIINSNNKFSSLKINKISHMLVPKKTFYDFRKCALIDIIDEIKYLSIVLLIANEIEKNRLSNKIVYSYRYKPKTNGRLFDERYNYSSFKREYKRISSMKKYNVIIDCDISNFYDRLNLHRLNSTLLSIKTIDEKITNTIDELLLFWANRDSYGLPVGSNASRILAEAFLIEIDNYLISNNIRFCRFVDDYRFFAKDVSEANKILSLFVNILNKHGLSINLGKTHMHDIKGYHVDSKKNKKIKQEGISEIIRGYSGVVPTKFRLLSDSEKERLKVENSDEMIIELNNLSIIDKPENIIKLIKTLVAKCEFKKFIMIPDILKKYPQFVPYFSDAIYKCREYIDKKIYEEILNKFSYWLYDGDTPEYIIISIVKLFDSTNMNEKKILLDYFRNLKRNTGIYIARIILEQIGSNLTRGELLELKDYYLRADNFEKRQIVKMVLDGLSVSENRPFVKDLLINSNDCFIVEMANKYNKKNRK